jgi:hypothetical protein
VHVPTWVLSKGRDAGWADGKRSLLDRMAALSAAGR